MVNDLWNLARVGQPLCASDEIDVNRGVQIVEQFAPEKKAIVWVVAPVE